MDTNQSKQFILKSGMPTISGKPIPLSSAPFPKDSPNVHCSKRKHIGLYYNSTMDQPELVEDHYHTKLASLRQRWRYNTAYRLYKVINDRLPTALHNGKQNAKWHIIAYCDNQHNLMEINRGYLYFLVIGNAECVFFENPFRLSVIRFLLQPKLSIVFH